MNVDELLAKAKKPSADAMRLHPFYRGKIETADAARVVVFRNCLRVSFIGVVGVEWFCCGGIVVRLREREQADQHAPAPLSGWVKAARRDLSHFKALVLEKCPFVGQFPSRTTRLRPAFFLARAPQWEARRARAAPACWRPTPTIGAQFRARKPGPRRDQWARSASPSSSQRPSWSWRNISCAKNRIS